MARRGDEALRLTLVDAGEGFNRRRHSFIHSIKIDDRKGKIMETKSKMKDLKGAAQQAVESLPETSEELQSRLGEFWETSRERAISYARATDRAIRENPYQTIGIALGLGLITGMLLNRGGAYYIERD
jgi:ElaB/YqjD/DUF883 family membrane-anchored ribosome-binding protein